MPTETGGRVSDRGRCVSVGNKKEEKDVLFPRRPPAVYLMLEKQRLIFSAVNNRFPRKRSRH